MRKSIGLLSLLVFIFATLFAGSAYAAPYIKWFMVQKRTYENGAQFTRVQFAVDDYSLVKDVHLLKDGVDQDVDINDFSFVEDTFYRSYYNTNTNIWDWSNVVGDWNVDYMFYLNSDITLEKNQTYRIEIDWDDGQTAGTETAIWHFYEVADLPVVSLGNEKDGKNKVGKLKPEFLDDGSMVVRWDAPIVTIGDTTQVVYLSIKNTSDVFKVVYINQPTHLGIVIIPKDVIDTLQSDSDYQGYFDFQVQLRTNDGCNITGSNWSRYYF